MDFSPDKIREHFHALSAQSSALREKLAPLQAELADVVSGDTKLSVKAANAREAELRAKIIVLNDQLYPVEMERAAACRALNGNTGPLREDAAFLAKG